MSEYINENFQNEKVINNLCPDQGNFFLKQNNQFFFFDYQTTKILKESKNPWLGLSEYLKKNNINYLLVDWEEKEKNYYRWPGSCSPDWQDYKDNILPLENLIKEHSELIFSEKGAELYKINLE